MYSALLGTRLLWRGQAVVSYRNHIQRLHLYPHLQSIPAKKLQPVEEIEPIRRRDIKLEPIIPLISKDNSLKIPKEVSHVLATPDAVKKPAKKRPDELPWRITPNSELNRLVSHYLMLSKIRLTSMVVITAMGGYAMAPAAFDLSTFVMVSLGTGLVSCAANTVNQFYETPFDAQMSRTKNRVLVKGYLTPLHAIGFATVAATTGICMLHYGVNGLTASLGAANLLLYTCVYTPMKRYSILNTWVGSVVGAIPPLMGWAGCSGNLEAGAWIMAGLLYAWQFPHFNALSWNLRPDYSRAGYRMMAVTNPALCRRVALRYTGIIAALSLSAPYFDVTNIYFALETLPLNGYFGYLAWKFYKESDSGSSRKLFRFSLLHLPLLMVLFILNKKDWVFKKTSAEDVLVAAVAAGENLTVKSDFPMASLLPKQKL